MAQKRSRVVITVMTGLTDRQSEEMQHAAKSVQTLASEIAEAIRRFIDGLHRH